jgi:hypothetical protein
MQWVTRKLSELLKRHGETLPDDQRTELNRLRFLLLACPERQAELSERQRTALARAWELVGDTVVEEALRLRNDLRAALNTSTGRAQARAQFDTLRETWPERFRPWAWRPGEPLPEPVADERAESAAGLRARCRLLRPPGYGAHEHNPIEWVRGPPKDKVAANRLHGSIGAPAEDAERLPAETRFGAPHPRPAPATALIAEVA